jgi:DNA-binding response OmpR family regulator
MQGKRILIVDDDPEIRAVILEQLTDLGFSVAVAENGESGVDRVLRFRPDLVLLDVELPDMSGYDVCKKIRSISEVRHTPVIMLTAHALEKEELAGFSSGADDYVAKPFKPARLLARINSAIGRNQRELDANALTHLPGNQAILEQIQSRLASGNPFSVLYFDLNNFKAFNDRYGFVHGDRAIQLTANILLRHFSGLSEPDAFLGHVGGDDFVGVAAGFDVEKLCQDVIAEFDRSIPELYEEPDRRRGMITAVDRRGTKIDVPLMGIAVAVVTNRQRTFSHPGEIALVAGDLKKWAKADSRSAYVIDRRT